MKLISKIVIIFSIACLSFIGIVKSLPTNEASVAKNLHDDGDIAPYQEPDSEPLLIQQDQLSISKEINIDNYITDIATEQQSTVKQNLEAAFLKSKYVGKTLVELGSYAPSYGYGKYVYEKNLPNPYRIIKPGMLITTDFIKSRLNLRVDETNKILSAFYG